MFDTEHTALLAAQRIAVRHAWHRAVWQLAWTLDTFHARRGHRHDRLAMWQAALDSAAHLPDPALRILVHRLLGHAYADVGQPAQGIDHLHQALTLAEEHHDSYQRVRAHRPLSWAW